MPTGACAALPTQASRSPSISTSASEWGFDPVPSTKRAPVIASRFMPVPPRVERRQGYRRAPNRPRRLAVDPLASSGFLAGAYHTRPATARPTPAGQARLGAPWHTECKSTYGHASVEAGLHASGGVGMPKLDAAKSVIASYIAGVQYPCSREDLILYCKQINCPDDTLEATT